MRIVVFLGPSLPLEIATDLLEAEFRGPVSLGDLCDLLVHDDPPDVVGIVDGLFEQVPAVWHKEILYAIDRGVDVFGSSSMGALRAAELHSFGMRGVGTVFERFRLGHYTDDDEVAIVHAGPEDGYCPLSEAMVNIRHGLERSVRDGILSPAQQAQLVAAAKARFYPDRSWPSVIESAERLGFPPPVVARLREFVRTERPDVKRADAVALLTTIAEFVADGPPSASPVSFEFEPTYYWDKLVTIVRDQRHRAAITDLVQQELVPADPVVPAAPPEMLHEALLDLLVAREAGRLGLRPPRPVGDSRREDLGSMLARHYRAELSGHVLARLRGAPGAPSAPGSAEKRDEVVPKVSSRAE